MSKKEYLDSLREFMSFELPLRLVEKNIQFYDGYFDEQMRLGKTLEEIEEELGDPQLIARTCIDAAKSGADGIPNTGDDQDFGEEINRENSKRTSYGSQTGGNTGNGQENRGNSRVHILSGAGCLIPIIIIIALISLVVSFISTPLGSGLLIGLLVIGAISAIIRYFKR